MYNRLFVKILDSSIWLEPPETRIVWITLLAAMDEDGYAHFAAIENLATRARVTVEQCRKAVECFMSPDPNSSNPENEGRRIERVPGGFMVLNAAVHRETFNRVVQREQTRIRVQNHRKQNSVGVSTDIHGTSMGHPPDGTVNEEEEFPILKCEEFKVAWEDWKVHRLETKKKLTPMAIRKQLKAMTKLGSSKAIAAIEFSIGNGYQGIFEPKEQNGTTHGHKTVSQERNSFIGDGKNQPHGPGGITAILKRRTEKIEQETREAAAKNEVAVENNPVGKPSS